MNFDRQKQLIKDQIQKIKQFIYPVWKAFTKCCPIYVILIIIIAINLHWHMIFPQQYKNIVPQQFDSHPVQDLSPFYRSLKKMKPTIYNSSKVSICQDIAINQNNLLYCINQNNKIIQLNIVSKKQKIIGSIQKGRNYGIRLSINEKILYFVNSELGLCQFNLQNHRIINLVSEYQSQFLISLNSVQIHPENQNILYFTQTSSEIPLKNYNIELSLNNPFGRIFQFNKESRKISLLAEGLYFPNGLIFQKYKSYNTLLVAETNRYRLIRIYLDEEIRGNRQVAIDKLHIWPDNIKQNSKGQLWIGSIGIRSGSIQYDDQHSWTKLLHSRYPQFLFDPYVIDADQFGGAIVKFSADNDEYTIKYCVWKSYQNYRFSTTLYEQDNKLYISSMFNRGIIVIDKIQSKLKRKQTQKDLWYNQKPLLNKS